MDILKMPWEDKMQSVSSRSVDSKHLMVFILYLLICIKNKKITYLTKSMIYTKPKEQNGTDKCYLEDTV